MAEIKPSTPRGHTIFCDDIRQEVSGKLIYIGVYTGLMTINALPPIALPKLCAAVSYLERSGESDDPIEIWVFLPGDSDVPSITMPVPIQRDGAPQIDPTTDDPHLQILLNFEFAPLQLKESGVIKVRIKRGNDLIRVGGLVVQFNPTDAAVSSVETGD